MALDANVTMVFQGYAVVDGFVQLEFYCPNPGAGQETQYFIQLTDEEITNANTVAKFKNLVIAKLQRKYRAMGIGVKLDPYIGQSLVI